MKCRARANGNVVELDEEAARQLIDAGIYEAVAGEQAAPATAAAVRKPVPTPPSKQRGRA